MKVEEIDQLTIFDVLYEFDETKANWTDILRTFERCTVLAMIPEEGMSPLENPFKRGTEDHTKRDRLWSDYTYAIFSYLDGDQSTKWFRACDMFKKHRDDQKPCPMVVYRSKRSDEFRPSHVVEYL